jgi:hypothetical protein
VTDKHSKDNFSIENIKQVTDKRNNTMITLVYPELVYPEDSKANYEKEDFGVVIELFGLHYRNESLTCLNICYDKFICDTMEVDYIEAVCHPMLYKNYFKIVRPSKLSMKLYWNDILYVYPDDAFLVVIDPKTASNFRKIRGIK